MRKYKRIKGWYVVAEHRGFPVYLKSGIQKRPYVWKKGQYLSLDQIERMDVDSSGKVLASS